MSFYDELIPGLQGHCWQVHKFGGTSVANADCFLQVAKIIEDQLDANTDHDAIVSSPSKKMAVVVSAMGGKPKVTDLLLNAVRYASTREHDKVNDQLNNVLEKHEKCLEVLFREQNYGVYERLIKVILEGLDDIRDILKTVSLMKWQAERISGEMGAVRSY